MSKQALVATSSASTTSSKTSSTLFTPTSSPSNTPNFERVAFGNTRIKSSRNMESAKHADEADRVADPVDRETAIVDNTEQQQPSVNEPNTSSSVKRVCCCRSRRKQTTKKSKRITSISALSSDSDSEDDSSTTSSSDDARSKKTKKAKKITQQKKRKSPKNKKSKSEESESEPDSLSDSESEVTQGKNKSRKKTKGTKKLKQVQNEASEEASDSGNVSSSTEELAALRAQVDALKLKVGQSATKKKKTKSSKSSKKDTDEDSAMFKRVDQVWDTETYKFELKESAGDDESEFAEYAFLVRRRFDCENKYQSTIVDIKSKSLRAALTDVMKNCKGVSLEAEEPKIEPNTLFLYLEELRTYYKKTLKAAIKAERRRKATKKLELQRSMVKALVHYIDTDYADTKKTLYPLLEAGNITFDLLWALFHPNDIAVTSCYGSWEEPRCFKVDFAYKDATMTRGEWYCIQGNYHEYDGKGFGYGDFESEIDAFKGPRKITSLGCYPLKFHKDADAVKKQLIQRGKQFVATQGMQYKFHKGMAFQKKKKQVAKINVNGRVMIDPATFRRVNPNYAISFIKPNESEDLFGTDDEDDEDDCCCCGGSSGDEGVAGGNENLRDDDDEPKYKYKFEKDMEGQYHVVEVEVDADGDPIRKTTLAQRDEPTDRKTDFTEEELLLTSPVVLGFAFSEKLWLEFTLSGVHDIEWNEDAFDSLVLPPDQKDIVQALVVSHKFHAAKTIDDVVQGKGKGLVSVLHGPPGTGKTLTAEGVSELLKCPLYMVSAGELGTDPGKLEYNLQQILDIAHSWGAILLLDEADVFLEKREVHDIHRNALVSIFLRLLEYFQGILFLTTNRVDTFDEAFQSRIHLALQYEDLTAKAKQNVFKRFLDKVREVEGMEIEDISDYDLEMLSRNHINGREIKNIVRTAQALALYEQKALSLEHMKRVLGMSEKFNCNMKGGSGYREAMRAYT